jgi:hypothetical protein
VFAKVWIRNFVNKILSLLGVKLIRLATLNEIYDLKANLLSHVQLQEIERQIVGKVELLEKLGAEQIQHQIATQWSVIDATEKSVVDTLDCALCGHSSHQRDFQVFSSHCIFEGGRLTRFKCPQCEVIFGPIKML